MMDELNKALDGRKTYLISALMGLLTFVFGMGWIDQTTYLTAMGVLTPANLAALRSGVGKGTA